MDVTNSKGTDISLMIVDDESSIRVALCQIFRCKGYRVRGAEDGFSALSQMRESLPQILLCDLNMPGMSGFELLSVVRRKFPEMYVIAMSGGFGSFGSPTGGEIPTGIAADAFYRKTSGMESLFRLINDGIASEKLPIFAKRCSVPIWVTSGDTRASDAAFNGRNLGELRARSSREVLLGCPECLRAFALPAEATGDLQTADCVYCSTSLQYAVVA